MKGLEIFNQSLTEKIKYKKNNNGYTLRLVLPLPFAAQGLEVRLAADEGQSLRVTAAESNAYGRLSSQSLELFPLWQKNGLLCLGNESFHAEGGYISLSIYTKAALNSCGKALLSVGCVEGEHCFDEVIAAEPQGRTPLLRSVQVGSTTGGSIVLYGGGLLSSLRPVLARELYPLGISLVDLCSTEGDFYAFLYDNILSKEGIRLLILAENSDRANYIVETAKIYGINSLFCTSPDCEALPLNCRVLDLKNLLYDNNNQLKPEFGRQELNSYAKEIAADAILKYIKEICEEDNPK